MSGTFSLLNRVLFPYSHSIMGLSDLLGQENARTTLLGILNSGQLAPSYLFLGPEGVGQVEYAYGFLKGVFCPQAAGDFCGECAVCHRIDNRTFSDTTWIELEAKGNVIEAERVRDQLLGPAMMMPMEADYKFIIINPAEVMSEAAANCLLKILEEPPSFCHILLLCGNVNRLLPTLYSRCQRVRFVPVDNALLEQDLLEHGTEAEVAKLAARLASGRPAFARSLAQRDLVEESTALLRDIYKALKGDGSGAFAAATSFGKDRNEVLECLALLRALLFDVLRLVETGHCEDGPLEKAIRGVAGIAGADALNTAIEAAFKAEEALRSYANTTITTDTALGELIGRAAGNG
jgi:DNA polymerase III subunit delta'